MEAGNISWRQKIMAQAIASPTMAEGASLLATAEFERAVEAALIPGRSNDFGSFATQFSALFEEFFARIDIGKKPVIEPPSHFPIRLNCPLCGLLHVDEGEFATKPHKSHACQGCGNIWTPALYPTIGVRFLPGTKNEDPLPPGEAFRRSQREYEQQNQGERS